MRYSVCYTVGEQKYFFVTTSNDRKVILTKITKKHPNKDNIIIKYAKELQSALDSIWQNF